MKLSRFKPQLAVKIEEEERRERQNISLRDQFEDEKEQIVYVESWPEKVFRLMLIILSTVLAVIGIIALIVPDTRALIIEVMLNFVNEMLGVVKLS